MLERRGHHPPTDSKLLETARTKLVEAAKEEGVELKQTFAKEDHLLGYKAGRYAHARQFRRMRKVIKRQRTIVGRLQREVARKMSSMSQAGQEALGKAAQAVQLARSGRRCISKGKSRTPYEFGVKVGIAMTLKGNLIVGAGALPGNPYDGHTLHGQV